MSLSEEVQSVAETHSSQGIVTGSMEVESMRSEKEVGINHAQVLLSPALLPFLSFAQLARWSELSKEYSFVIENYSTDIGYYESLSNSFSMEHGLYFPQMKNARNYFFNTIWTNRLKWRSTEDQSNFKIRVSSRFSPGTRSNEKIDLPLHQFLAVYVHSVIFLFLFT